MGGIIKAKDFSSPLRAEQGTAAESADRHGAAAGLFGVIFCICDFAGGLSCLCCGMYRSGMCSCASGALHIFINGIYVVLKICNAGTEENYKKQKA